MATKPWREITVDEPDSEYWAAVGHSQQEAVAESAAYEASVQAQRLAYEADADNRMDYSGGPPIEVDVGVMPMSEFVVGFDSATTRKLRTRAEAEGVGVTDVIKRLVRQHLERVDG